MDKKKPRNVLIDITAQENNKVYLSGILVFIRLKPKKNEFSSKVSFTLVPETNIIVGIENSNGNLKDSKTLIPAFKNVEKISSIKFSADIVE